MDVSLCRCQLLHQCKSPHGFIATVWSKKKAKRKSFWSIDCFAYPLCPCVCVLCVCSWSTTEWSSASGGWPSSKPSSSRPRAPCLITTSTPRARSLNPGPKWCPRLRWMLIYHFRYNSWFWIKLITNNKRPVISAELHFCINNTRSLCVLRVCIVFYPIVLVSPFTTLTLDGISQLRYCNLSLQYLSSMK